VMDKRQRVTVVAPAIGQFIQEHELKSHRKRKIANK